MELKELLIFYSFAYSKGSHTLPEHSAIWHNLEQSDIDFAKDFLADNNVCQAFSIAYMQ